MSEQFVITGLSISGLIFRVGTTHPEQTPVGPFDSREAAWECAAWMQVTYGDGGGSVEVARLHVPRLTTATTDQHRETPMTETNDGGMA